VTTEPEQFGGGVLLAGGGCGKECANPPSPVPNARKSAMGGAQDRDLGESRLPGHRELSDSANSTTTNCVTLPVQRRNGVRLRAVGIELDVRGWVKNVLIPALIDEFIEGNGKAPR
jgi:hypothetical protein